MPLSILHAYLLLTTMSILPAIAQDGPLISRLNSLPEVEFAQLSQRDPNPLGQEALAIHPDQWKHALTEPFHSLLAVTPGLLWEPLLSTFACEKYVVTTDPVQFDTADHYEFVQRDGSIYLFRNKAFLPFGTTFVRYFPEDQFVQMPKWAKSQALLHAAVLSDKDVPGKVGLSPITLDELKQRMRETLVPDALAERRASAFNMRSFEETRIEGTIRLERQGILLFQMPFDAGWHAVADGRTAPVIRVDAGLLGVLLESGEHSVRLSYRPPLLYTGASFTLVSLSLFLLGIWRWPRIRLPL